VTTYHINFLLCVLTCITTRNSDNEVNDDAKREAPGKRTVVDRDGKTKEVDIYERGEGKKKDPEKMKAIFSSSLE